MPVTKSAKKALKRDRRRHAENTRVRVNLKNAVDSIIKGEQSQENLGEAYSAIDRAIKNNLVSKNKGARVKSRLSRLLVKKTETVAPKKPSSRTKAAKK